MSSNDRGELEIIQELKNKKYKMDPNEPGVIYTDEEEIDEPTSKKDSGGKSS